MKRILKKGLISILIVLIVFNFISASTINISYGFDIGDIFSGLIGVITWIPRAGIMACLMGLNKLITAFANFGLEGIEGYGLGDFIGFTEDSYITPFHIFFNKIALLDVNFLNFDGLTEGGTVYVFRTAVAGWYYTMRLIACMVLAVILIYIGIRMAISTIASEKAMYKKMLVDWVTSLALLFLLHYIMLFTFACNEALVKAIEAVCEDTKLDEIMLTLNAQAFGIQIVQAVAAMALYFAVMWQALTFLFTYVKRMLTIGFLIMIAPLITITYSIDKIGDQKAQALNTWLKEFVYNVLIQPFHCILFAAFTSVAFQLIQSSFFEDTNIAALILAICCMTFIKEGEKLVQKIFGFGQASSLASMAFGAAITMSVAKQSAKGGQVVGAGAKKLIASNSDKISKMTGKLSNSVGGLAKKFDKYERNTDGSIKRDDKGNVVLSEHGRRVAERRAASETRREIEGNRYLQEDKHGQDRADLHNANYERIAKEMSDKKGRSLDRTEKFKNVVGTPMRKVKEANNDRKERKLDEYVKSHQHQRKEGVTDEQFREQCRKEIRENSKVRKIGSAVGHIPGAATDFVLQHSDQISQVAVGGLFALMGAAADGGRGAAIGYGFGKGLGKGYMDNTDKTVQSDAQSKGQAVANMHEGEENFDMERYAYSVYASAQNGEYDKLSEKLDKILDKIQGLNSDQKNGIKSSINMQMLKDPKGLNDKFLQDILKQFGADKIDGAQAGVHQYASLLADANFAKSMTTAANTRGLEEVISLVQQNTYIDKSTTKKVDASQHNSFDVTNHFTSGEEPNKTAPKTPDQVAEQIKTDIPQKPTPPDDN